MPDWLQPDWTKNYHQGFEHGIQRRQVELQERVQDNREQQQAVENQLRFKAYQIQQQKVAADVLGKFSKQSLDAQTQLGLAELDSVMSNANNLGGWASPNFEKVFSATASKYPQVTMTPTFRSYREMIESAKKEKATSERAALTQQAHERIAIETARIRGEQGQALEQTRHENAILLEEFRQEGKQAQAEAKLKSRIGDMGFQAFMGQKQNILSDKEIKADVKKRRLDDLFQKAQLGYFNQSVHSDNPASTANPSSRKYNRATGNFE